jgi:hypothetical protein
LLSFVGLDRSLGFVPGLFVMQLAHVDIGRGRQELFRSWPSPTGRRGRSRTASVSFVLEHAPQIFRIADVRVALPGVSDPTIRLTLEQLKNEGRGEARGSRPVRRLGEGPQIPMRMTPRHSPPKLT